MLQNTSACSRIYLDYSLFFVDRIKEPEVIGIQRPCAVADQHDTVTHGISGSWSQTNSNIIN